MPEVMTVDLPANLTIAEADGVYEVLDSALSQHHDVILNAEIVQRIDTTGIQLLYAFIRELQRSHTDVKWLAPSSSLLTAAQHLGMIDLLALPQQQ